MIRTHLGRRLDLSLSSNRLIIGLTALAGIAGLLLWMTGDSPKAWLAPVHTFLMWALVRELDPDRHWTALIAAGVAGGWVLAGLEIIGALALGGFLLAGRLVLNPVGLRPLNTDLVAMAIAAGVVSFTAVGWVAGSGIAVAIYIDERLSDRPRRAALLAAIGAALGASAVATISEALPETLPSIRPLLVVVMGLLALLAVIRDPLPVLSTVDSSDLRSMERERLHGSRTLIGVLLFVAALLVGPSVTGLGPIMIAFALVLASEEVKRIRRPTL